jgi:hypothetical protein
MGYSTNTFGVMWLLVSVLLGDPKASRPVFDWCSVFRLVLFLLQTAIILRYLWHYRGSPTSHPSRVLYGAVSMAILATAAVTEFLKAEELSNSEAYYKLVWLSICEFGLCLFVIRWAYGLFLVRVPGPLLASFTILWKAWHLFRGTHDKAILQAHRTHGKTAQHPG